MPQAFSTSLGRQHGHATLDPGDAGCQAGMGRSEYEKLQRY
jgi:hypothetical protein